MLQDLLQTFAALHRAVFLGLGQHIAEMQASTTGAAFAVVFAFALGLLHAMTPGHGKAIVFSYLVGYEARPWRGMAMGLRVAAIHVVSGIAVFVVLQFVLERTFASPLPDLPGIQTASYVIVSLAGAYLLLRAATRPHAPQRDDRKGSQHLAGGFLSVAVGLLPCPLTILVLTYALANGTFVTGLALTAVMALGIATTIGLVGALAVLARRYAIGWLAADANWSLRVMRTIEIVSAGFVFVFGLAMLLGVLTPSARNPFSA